jgi:hypothetical protein
MTARAQWIRYNEVTAELKRLDPDYIIWWKKALPVNPPIAECLPVLEQRLEQLKAEAQAAFDALHSQRVDYRPGEYAEVK